MSNPRLNPITAEEVNAACVLIESGWGARTVARVLKRDEESLIFKVRRAHRERMNARKMTEIRP